MNKKFKDLLHQYKVDAYRIAHQDEHSPEAAAELHRFAEEALNNAYHFHFHQDPSPEQLETLTLVKSYTLEALMPPVIEKVMRRVVTLERQQVAMVQLVDRILEALSNDLPEH